MMQYRLHVEETARKFWQLQTFLSQQDMSQQLAMAVKMQVRSRVREKTRMKMSSVSYLSLVSKSLLEQLRYHDVATNLVAHAFFNGWGQIDPSCMISFCNRAVQSRDLAL